MKKALVVDDTKNIRTLLTTCLELNNYEVDACASGSEALKKLEANIYDLIFMDVKMPGMSGTELLKEIRERGILTKVIMITAFATVKNAIECTKLGVVEYLHKPFTADKINNVLEKLDEESRNVTSVESAIKGAQKLMENERYDESIMFLKKALAEEPSNYQIYEMLSKCYFAKGDHILGEKFKSCKEVFIKK